MTKKFSILCIIAAFLTMSMVPALAQQLQDQAEAVIAEADSNDADFLSPKTLGKAKEALDDAKKAIAKKKAQKDIDALLNRAIDQAKKASETADIGHKVLSGVIPARARAMEMNAPTAAKKEWENAKDLWDKVIGDLEDNSLDAARKREREMIDRFNRAETEAVRNTVLRSARDAVESARKLGAETYSPLTFRSAAEALQSAEDMLKQNAYTGAKAQEAAKLATMEGKHAQKIAEMAKKFEKEKSGWEKGFLYYEEFLLGFSRRMNLDLDWSDGADGASRTILLAIDSLRLAAQSQMSLKDQKYTFLEKNFQDTRTRLESELSKTQLRVAELESRLGIAQRESDVLKRQKMIVEKATLLSDNFSAKEAKASVVDPKGTILLRLSGLSFPAGSSNVTNAMQKLLNKVVSGLQEFSTCSFVVEGHSDSSGDEVRNKKISQDRAAAVADYLRSNLGLSESRITSTGYGSEKPIADNSTREGRIQNRRIDILIRVP